MVNSLSNLILSLITVIVKHNFWHNGKNKEQSISIKERSQATNKAIQSVIDASSSFIRSQ